MRRPSFVVGLFLLAGLLCQGAVRAAVPATTDSAVRAAYVTLAKAYEASDAKAIAPFLAADFSNRTVTGTKEDSAAYLSDVSGTTPGTTVSAFTIAVDHLDGTATTAQADCTYTIVGTYAIGGATKAMSGTITVSDAWILVDGAWKMRSDIVHSSIASIDGKVVQSQFEDAMPSPAAIAEAAKRAIPIRSLRLDADPNEFTRIGAAIGNNRIVGMGEGTHGTSEFFAFKNRLFKYLVEKKGFTVFGIEASWGGGLAVDRYIKGGPGTAKQAVAMLQFWTWDVPEVVDLVQWMHDYNAKSGKHPTLSFVGFDMQDDLGAIGFLNAYERTHDPAHAAATYATLACAATIYDKSQTIPPNCRAKIVAFGKHLDATGPLAQTLWAREAVAIILQYLNDAVTGNLYAQRDADMALNVRWIADSAYPHAKIALWAHNMHIGSSNPDPTYTSMGMHLRSSYGENYYTIGQTFSRGTVRAIAPGKGLTSIAVPARDDDSIATLLPSVKVAAFLDIRGLPHGDALQRWFAGPHKISEIGGTLDPAQPYSQIVQIDIPSAYDALVYIPVSTASIPGVSSESMDREITSGGASWRVYGADNGSVSATFASGAATLTNGDGLDVMANSLMRKFDATPFRRSEALVSADVRARNLSGYVAFQATASDATAATLRSARSGAITAPPVPKWVHVSVRLAISKDATMMYAGAVLAGTGSVDVRNVTVVSAPAIAVSEATLFPDSWQRMDNAGSVYATTDTKTGGWHGGPDIAIIGSGAGSSFGTYSQWLPAAPYLGKTIRASGMLRTIDAKSGSFWMRVDGTSGALAFDNMRNRALVGTRDWTPFSIVLKVPPTATKIFAGLLLLGDGAIHGANLHIEIVPDSTPTTP